MMRRLDLAPLLCAAVLLGACGASSEDTAPPGDPILLDEANGSAGGAEGEPDDAPGPDIFIGGGESGDEGLGDGLEPGVFQPGVAGNVEASRLVSAMARVLEMTLVDLNARLRGGVPLTERRRQCLAAHEPALGAPAFSLECARPLSIGGVAVHVHSGAFFPTEACAADLAVGTADRCVMASAVMTLHAQLELGPGGRLPLPGTGVVVGYAPDRPVLSLESDGSGALGLLDCEFELQNGALLPSIGGVDGCRALVRDVADRIEAMLPLPRAYPSSEAR